MKKTVPPLFVVVTVPIFRKLADYKGMHKRLDKIEFQPDKTMELVALERLRIDVSMFCRLLFI